RQSTSNASGRKCIVGERSCESAQTPPPLRVVARSAHRPSRTIAGMRITRLARIVMVALKHGLDEFALGHERTRALRPFVNAFFFWRDLSSPRAVRLRQALEDLGPIFVKFGQMLSTRRDLLPTG